MVSCLANRFTYFLTVSAYSAAETSVNVPFGASFSSHEKNSQRATASLILNYMHRSKQPYHLKQSDKRLTKHSFTNYPAIMITS